MTTANTKVKKPITGMKMSVDANKRKLKIEVDLDKFTKFEELPLSASGNSYLIASTHGAEELHNELSDVKVSLNVYVPKKAQEARMAYKNQQEIAKEVAAPKLPSGLEALAGLDPATLNALVALANAMGGKK